MARTAYKPKVNYNTYAPRKTITPVVSPVKFTKKQKKVNSLKKIILFIFALILAVYVFPYTYKTITGPLFRGNPYPAVKTDYQKIYKPTSYYLYNDTFLGVNFLKSAEIKKPQMQTFYEAGKMQILTAKLNNLIKQYPIINPSIYVWDFETGRYVDIKANTQYPAASIIKIPVLLELFRSIEAGQVNLNHRMTLTDYFRAEGSGSLQFARYGSTYSLDHLARIMIQDSDNSATNMVMSAIGGKPAINRAIKKWGLKNTYIENWLPDLKGTNYTSSKDIALMLYNIDNTSFLSLKSRESIIDYMSHVKNNRLLQAGLPNNAVLIHKTGDIGSMLGDAGIVWTPQGKKYIVVILAKRPYNHPYGKEFIVKASSLIYNSINQNMIN